MALKNTKKNPKIILKKLSGTKKTLIINKIIYFQLLINKLQNNEYNLWLK